LHSASRKKLAIQGINTSIYVPSRAASDEVAHAATRTSQLIF